MEDGKPVSSIDLANIDELALHCNTIEQYSAYLNQTGWPTLQTLSSGEHMIEVDSTEASHIHIAGFPYMRELSGLLPTNKLRCVMLNCSELPKVQWQSSMEIYLCLRESERVIPQVTNMLTDMQSCEILHRYFEFPNLSCLRLSFECFIREAKSLGSVVQNLTMLDLGSPTLEDKNIMLIAETLHACRTLKSLRYTINISNVSPGYYDDAYYATPFLLAVKARYATAPSAALTEQELLVLLPLPIFYDTSSFRMRNMALNLVQAPERNLTCDGPTNLFFLSASYSEALLRACEEIASLEYLQIFAPIRFYVSPALQCLVLRHTTLRQVLLRAEYRPYPPRPCTYHDITRTRHVRDYLPTVSYRVVACLHVNFMGYSSEHDPLGTCKMSAVVDVGRRHEFHDLARISNDPVYEFDLPFDEDVVFNNDFVGWV